MDYEGQNMIAFWAMNKQTENQRLAFMSSDSILGAKTYSASIDEAELNSTSRILTVEERNGIWYAGYQTVQKDFEQHPWFIVSPLTGPHSLHDAAMMILNDHHFKNFFGASSGMPQIDNVYARFEHYTKHLDARKRGR
jgi:hypothetical protein